MANVVVSLMDFRPVYENPVEIVERKGTGHPDTICDNLAEELSVALCKLYLEEFGFVQHHNVDKALLVGGVADPRFGGGEIITPIEIYLVGRAVKEKDGKLLPVDELAIEVAKEWLRKNIRNLDPDKHVIITPQNRALEEKTTPQEEAPTKVLNQVKEQIQKPLEEMKEKLKGLENLFH